MAASPQRGRTFATVLTEKGRRGILQRALLAPPLTGRIAWIFGAAALTIPSLVRASVDGSVSTAVFLTYIPFVFLAAISLSPKAATAIAIGSGIVADFLFMEPRFALAATPNVLFSFGIFLIASALIIGFVSEVRRFLKNCLAPTDGTASTIIFSEKKGEAWASWHGGRPSVKLGPHTKVARMMEDYVAQVELGERLTGRSNRS